MDVDGRCVHYGGPADVVALRLRCCDRYYACHACHGALSDHDALRWSRDSFDRRAVLCGRCGARMTIAEYRESDARCPGCGGDFNPRCALHHPLYFEV